MINNTFENCYFALALGAIALKATSPPFLELDPQSLKCILSADVLFYDDSLTFPVTIYFNCRLFELFSSFPNVFQSDNGDLNYQLKVHNNKGSNLNKLTNTFVNINGQVQNTIVTYVQMYQEVSTISLWNPIAPLVFCSSMLRIYPTQTSKPKIISNESNTLSSNGDNSNLTNILSDFEVAIQDTNSYRPFILYSPQSEYRLMDMYSSSNLNRINISVFWKDHFGNLNPFYLDAGCSAHMKLMFRRKDFYVAG
jgi:hypothetical protein